jgi:membrane protein implicated in regulation of membrane protease activity
MVARRRVWIHRAATIVCVALAVPALLWWRNSITFVILLSLATQAWTSLSAAEAADDRALSERLDRIEALLEQRRTDE